MKKKSSKSSINVNKIPKRRNKDDWRVALDSTFINDDRWWCITTMMVETMVQHSRYVSLFNEAAEEGTCIYSLSHQKAIDTVKTLSKRDPEKCPAIMGICHYANTVLNENNGHLSTWLAARIIKYLIYRAKIEQLRRLEVEEDLDREIDEEYRAISNIASSTSLRNAVRPRRSDNSQTKYAFSSKVNAHSHVNDISFDGPNLYVVLSGFHDPDLPAELLHVGVPLICILKIKPTDEREIASPETKKKNLVRRDTSPHFSEDYRADENELYKFWTVTPRQVPEEHETGKRIFDKRNETMEDTRIYEAALSDIPNEYINVPVLLGAILLQVESNLAGSRDGCVPVKRNAGFSDDADKGDANTSTTAEGIPVFDVRDKLRLLDLEYELIDECASRSLLPSDLEVTLYRDTLRTIVRRFLDRESLELDDAVLRVLRDPRIIDIWRNREVSSDMYSCHVDNIADVLNRDRSSSVGREEILHYLHLLVFDKLIFSGDKSDNEGRASSKKDSSKLKRSVIKRTRSLSDLTTSSRLTVSSLRRFKSDTEIDYDKPVLAFTDCPLLFALTDTREALLPGYLHENVFGRRRSSRSSLEEYEDVELLPKRVFLQTVYECFQSFDRLASRYFEPTDSMLLYFSNDNRTGDAFEETRLSTIRTPIGLGEFCEYIAEEEENWMERETRQSPRMDLTGRFMKRPVELEDDAIIFADECFVLPGSLKAKSLAREDSQRRISETKELVEERKINEAITGDKQADGGRVMSGRTSSSTTRKKSGTRIDDVDTSSFLSMKKILSSRCEDSYDFVGYDLGSLRVQVIHHSKKFLLDDTTVRVDVEDWLHRDTDIRISITLQRCTLRLSTGVGRRQSTNAFHLTTESGIVLGFCRNENRKFDAVGSSSNCHWQHLAFDFRASWPSGLWIEPAIVGDGTKDPFCIRQSYVSKRPGRAKAAHEVCRNFLRSGTVLKHMDDNTVVILRPNSVIVTCMDFDKSQSYDESTRSTTLKEFRNKKGNSMVAQGGEKVIGSTESRFNGSIVDEEPSKRHKLSSEKHVISDWNDPLITGSTKVLRYSVVNYDGRRYEVLNDLVVSEHDRLLVRTVSDYEVNEVFTRRADGTDTLLRSNGELVVIFPDGTRIITGYIIEEHPVICDWSEDELRRYLGYREPDGFVSILLTFRMEHEDYATVSYDQSAVGCSLSMPDNLRVSISGEGHYEVSMGDKVNLKIRDDVTTLSEICATCGGESISTYKFRKSSDDDDNVGARTILRTIDILGNVLEVKSDGTTSYRRPHIRKEDEGLGGERGGDERVDEEEDADSGTRIRRKHGRYCEMLKFPARSQYRIFAMNRDLTACEYLHRSVRARELAAVFGDETSMIQYPISRQPELRRLITFVPMEPESGSKEISGFCQYRIRSHKRTDYGETELPRSTYSFPYNWLFPFGRKDQRVPERIRSKVLAKRNEQPLPKLLRVRVFFGIKEADRNALIDMQRVMGRYWISLISLKFSGYSVILRARLPIFSDYTSSSSSSSSSSTTQVFRDGDKCRLFCAKTGSSRPCEVENDYGSSESSLRELALGVKGSIDVETYVRSLQGKLIKVSTKAPRQSSRLAELLRQRGPMKEEYEWYKQCMRKRIIVPYFRNIAFGSSCSLTKDRVDEEIFSKSSQCVEREEDEFINSNRTEETSCPSLY
ncbi:uncharacterized protein LOC114942652 [Nylanderia fulva]|uniref:uncharacterized protein LOC114942652 n=1 Tax=Nylanderia fulva TaxID=613905 RepID=UPI0010FB85B5|nr:uncharacterized protein LOC114942652 [Nylanderia fulva]